MTDAALSSTDTTKNNETHQEVNIGNSTEGTTGVDAMDVETSPWKIKDSSKNKNFLDRISWIWSRHEDTLLRNLEENRYEVLFDWL